MPAFEAALQQSGKTYTLYGYDGVNHAFTDDTSPARYDAAAADARLGAHAGFFEQNLGAG